MRLVLYQESMLLRLSLLVHILVRMAQVSLVNRSQVSRRAVGPVSSVCPASLEEGVR